MKRMKKMKKRVLAMVLAMILATAPCGSIFAQEVTNPMPKDEQEQMLTEEVTESESSSIEETEVPETSPEGQTESEETQTTETQTTETQTTEEQETTEETETEVSKDTLSDNSVSSNEAKQSTEELFPGLPKTYTMSQQELASKNAVTSYWSDFTDSQEGKDYVAGEVIANVNSQEEAELYAQAYGANLKSYADGVAVIELDRKVSVAQAMSASGNMRMAMPPVWPNYYRYKMVVGETKVVEDLDVETFGYSDPALSPIYPGYQWHHDTVGSMYAWNGGYTGQGIKVAVLDTGGTNEADVTFVKRYNTIKNDEYDTADADGHGTHVAGIIGAKRGNSKAGAGIAPDVSLYGIKVLAENMSTDADIVEGINHAVNVFGVDIINMSLGGPAGSDIFTEALNNAREKGTAVFASAGNDYSSVKSYPAACDNVISVAATNQSNIKADFSNYGKWIDLCAPGVDIASTLPGNTYGIMSGTSQASPIAAGTAAVILSAKIPSIEGKTGGARVDALVSFMKANVIKGVGSGIGAGIVYLPKALKVSTVLTSPNKPTFDKVAQGKYSEDINLAISAEEGMQIIYTVDGKTPSFKDGKIVYGNVYTAPITLPHTQKSVAVKAIAVNEWGKTSALTSATYSFEVVPEAVTITGANKLIKGKSITLKAVVDPISVSTSNKSVYWTLVETGKGVTISSSGKVTATSKAEPGEYTIKATPKKYADVEGTYKITVVESAKVSKVQFYDESKKKTVSTISLIHKNTDVVEDISTYLKVTLKQDNTLGGVGDVTFSSSNPAIAKVDAAGKVTISDGGKVVITATANDGSGLSAKVTLQIAQAATDVLVSGNLTIAASKSTTLKATLLPANTTNKKVIWALVQPVQGVSVSSSGKITVAKNTPAGEFKVKVTAADGSGISKEVTCKITSGIINRIELLKDGEKKTAINIFRKSVRGESSDTQAQINVSVQGTDGFDATQFSVISSKSDIVEILPTADGFTAKATGKATGTSVITVKTTDGSNKSATLKVTVNNPVTQVFISPEVGRSRYIALKKTLNLSAKVEMGMGPVANKKVIWSSSNPDVAKVTNGKVTAVGYGSAIIEVTSDDGSKAKAQYVVYVLEPLKKIGIDCFWEASNIIHTVPLSKKAFVGLLYNVDGNGQQNFYDFDSEGFLNCNSDFNFIIEVSNPEIVGVANMQKIMWSIDEYRLGVIFYLKEKGTTNITIKSMDGTKVYKSYKLKVE